MNRTQTAKRDSSAFAWGAIFIWWGITELFPSLPAGTGAIGIGLILLGLNAARCASGVSASRFSITIGILAVVWGALELAGAFLALPFELPVFAILLMVMGAVVLIQAIGDNRIKEMGGLQ